MQGMMRSGGTELAASGIVMSQTPTTDPPNPRPTAPPPESTPPEPARTAGTAARARQARLWLAGLGLLAVGGLLAGLVLWQVSRAGGRGAVRPPWTAAPRPTATEPPGPAFFPPPEGEDAPEAPEPALPDALATAEQAMREGRYADAAALYAGFAAGDPALAETREGRWGLALCRYELGAYDEAIAGFAAFAADYPADPRAVRAAFWAGQAHAAAGRPGAALDQLKSYAPQAGAGAGAVRLRAADLAVRAGRVDEAFALLDAVLAGEPTRLERINAWERLATLESDAGRPALALAWLDRILAEAEVPNYRAGIMLRAARAAAAAGDWQEARRRYLELIAAHPDTDPAYQALHRLLEQEGDLFTGGALRRDTACRVAHAARKYREAIGYCEGFRTAQAPGPERADAAWYTARAYTGLGNHAQAASWYRGFAEVYPADPRAPRALLGWGEALAAQGLRDEALAQWDKLLATYPSSPEAAEAQHQAGILLRRAGDPVGAAARWTAAAAAPGADDEARSRARFWQGWALDWAGQPDAARAAWQATAAYPGFYGFRAAAWLAGERTPYNPGAGGSLDALAAATALADQEARAAELWGWVRGWPALPGAATRWAATERLTGLPEYRVAVAQARLGLWVGADEAFLDLTRRLVATGDGAGLAALLEAMRHEGWVWLEYRVALALRQAAGGAGVPTALDRLPRALQEGLYPVAWGALVGRETGARNIDPWLLLGLIRQESAYDPRARSWSDARGLTQVIPPTGRALAQGLRVPDFALSDLYRPAVSVRFGAQYLGETLARFDGNVFRALAGYNAGPGHVPGWATGPAAADADLFVAAIDFPETEHYVRIVWENYQIYRRLYMAR
jgi:soluble lytic murein transglycosylase